MVLLSECPVFQLDEYEDWAVNETADITFYTVDRAVCLIACFDLAHCNVAVYEKNEDKCQLFTTRGVEDITLSRYLHADSDIYYRTCKGTICSK